MLLLGLSGFVYLLVCFYVRSFLRHPANLALPLVRGSDSWKPDVSVVCLDEAWGVRGFAAGCWVGSRGF